MNEKQKPKKMNLKVLVLVVVGTLVWMAVFLFASSQLNKLGDIGKVLVFLLMFYMIWLTLRIIEGKKEIIIGYAKKKKR